LWTSPTDSGFGWKDWLEAEDWGEKDLNTHFTVQLKPSARVLAINRMEDVSDLPMFNLGFVYWLDWEAISQMYDAVHLTLDGFQSTRYNLSMIFAGWDCECVLILNKNCFTVLNDKK
jgi:hypothetical protein